MSPTKTEQQFQTTGYRHPHAEPPDTRGIKVLRERAVIYKGVCSNCEKLETCAYPSTTSDTWFCEEYSYEKPVATPKEQSADVQEEAQAQKFAGLCLNCELRETCALPKAPGGVWFCGEYE
jgi:hypothetical protein